MDEKDKPLGERNFEQFARRYAASVDTKPHNAYYDRPAVISLLPPVQGKRVFDAGCGPGVYAEWLLNQGAEVVAVDVAPTMVELAQERVGNRATVLRANLEEPLTFAADASFDIALSALVLDSIEGWDTLSGELYRVLKPGGVFVFSCPHPITYREERIASYFATQRFQVRLNSYGEPPWIVTGVHRPLSAMINPLIDAGFAVDRLLEPLPTEAFRAADPQEYERLMRAPVFLCIRAIKD